MTVQDLRPFLLSAIVLHLLLPAIEALGQENLEPVVHHPSQKHGLLRKGALEKEPLSMGFSMLNKDPKAKSGLRAVLLSLLLPGMGELYADGFEGGKYFLGAEAGLWLTFTGFEVYGHWLQNDARTFAARHASAQIDGKDDQFFINVGNFMNVYDYNEKKLRDRDPARLYEPNGGFFWQWDTDQSRTQYRDLRVKSDNVLNNVRFVVAAIVINHVASAINAARIARNRNAELSSESWDIHAFVLGSLPRPTGVVLRLQRNF